MIYAYALFSGRKVGSFLQIFNHNVWKTNGHSPLHLHLRRCTLVTWNPAWEAAHTVEKDIEKSLCGTIIHYPSTHQWQSILVSKFGIIRPIYVTQILLVFTCAAVEDVHQNDEQQSNTCDPGHDGGVRSLRSPQSFRLFYGKRETLVLIYQPCPRPCGSAEFHLWEDLSWQALKGISVFHDPSTVHGFILKMWSIMEITHSHKQAYKWTKTTNVGWTHCDRHSSSIDQL